MSLQSFKLDLLSRVDIVDVVERYITLRKAGANFSACCPFHSEKTPSFTVSPSKQFYHCFGCGAHGNAIDFIMQYSGLEFMEALEDLARSAGLEVPRFSRETAVRREEKAPLTEVMARAAAFYRECLKNTPRAIDYLKRRGLSGEIAARFGIGYAPEGWQGLQQVFPNYEDGALVDCGLLIVNEQGRRYDRFRDRVMFPILDTRGQVIAFGGRVIGEGEPKYLNSPETTLFEKGRELYGLPQARKAVHEADTILVVEGYMDVVGLAQSGVENVVATLGTAATDANVAKLLKQASKVVFCFDRDVAGDRAAWRAMEVSLAHVSDNRVVEILQLPGDQDPDEFIREHGREAFVQLTRGATRLSEFFVRELVRRTNPTSAEGRAKLVHEAKPLLQKVAAPVLRAQLAREIAQRAQLTPSEIEAQCELKPLARARSWAPPAKGRPAPSRIERKLLEIVLQQPAWAARLPLELIPQDSAEGAALMALADAVDHGSLGKHIGDLLEQFRGSPHQAILAEMAPTVEAGTYDPEAMEEVFTDAIGRLRDDVEKREVESLMARARAGETLSVEERRRLTQLLARRVGAVAAGSRAI